MLEQDRLYLSKFAIDPEADNFESYEIPEFDFTTTLDPDEDNGDIDGMDEDLWGEY